MYDLEVDRPELHDVFGDPAYRVRAAQLFGSLAVRLAKADHEKRRIDNPSVDDESFLRSLGYLQ